MATPDPPPDKLKHGHPLAHPHEHGHPRDGPHPHGHEAYVPEYRPKQHVFKSWKIPGTSSPQWTIFGWSRSMAGTGFFIPELQIMLDAGISHLPSPSHVFCTHGHQDHSMVLGGCAATYVVTKQPLQLFAPAEVAPYCAAFVEAALQMNWCSEVNHASASAGGCPEPYLSREFPFPYDVVECRAGMTFDLSKLGSNSKLRKAALHVEIFECHHSVPSRGYGFHTFRPKLKAEYAGLAGREIGALRKSGVEVNEVHKHPILAFMGDTTVKALESNADRGLLDYPVIIIECTFIHPDHRAEAASRGHTHWLDLEPYVRAHPDTTFMLIHFSLRYTDREILEFFDGLDDKPANIKPWILSEEEELAMVGRTDEHFHGARKRTESRSSDSTRSRSSSRASTASYGAGAMVDAPDGAASDLFTNKTRKEKRVAARRAAERHEAALKMHASPPKAASSPASSLGTADASAGAGAGPGDARPGDS